MISTNTIENDEDYGRQFQSVICFRDHRSLRAFVCELFPITSINQDVLLATKYTQVLIALMRH